MCLATTDSPGGVLPEARRREGRHEEGSRREPDSSRHRADEQRQQHRHEEGRRGEQREWDNERRDERGHRESYRSRDGRH